MQSIKYEHVPAPVAKLFGGVAEIRKLPVCGPFPDGQLIGDTGYFDVLENRHLEHPVQIGTDSHGRVYIALNTGENYKKALVLFQRYVEDPLSWSFAGNQRIKNAQEILADLTNSKGEVSRRKNWENLQKCVQEILSEASST